MNYYFFIEDNQSVNLFEGKLLFIFDQILKFTVDNLFGNCVTCEPGFSQEWTFRTRSEKEMNINNAVILLVP